MLDLWRSLAVLTMLIFHLLWDLECFGVLRAGTMESPLADVIRYLGGGSFIFISGLLSSRSRQPVRRGFIIFGVGLCVSLVTAIAGQPILFGALQLIGVSMMITGAMRTRFRQMSSRGYLFLWLALFFLTWVATARVRVTLPFLFPLGLRTESFYSADYWPIIPWTFLYLTGSTFGTSRAGEKILHSEMKLPDALTFLGKYSLVIYLVHQPVLYGVCLIVFGSQ